MNNQAKYATENHAEAHDNKASFDVNLTENINHERRIKSVIQGYTGNICFACQNFTIVHIYHGS